MIKSPVSYLLILSLLFFPLLTKAQNGELGFLKRIYTTETLPADGFFRFMSHTAGPVAVCIPVLYTGTGLTKKDKQLSYNTWLQQGIRSGLTIGGAGLISYTLKITVQRERPFTRDPSIIPKMSVSTRSFPSGHTTFAFATATTVSLHHRKWYITIPMYAWATAVAYSRLHLGVHYPTDLLGGMVIGCGTGLLVHHLSKKWFGPRAKKETPALF